MMQVVRGALHDPRFTERYAEQMYRLRYKIFHERLRWDVKTHGDQEHDEFDNSDSVYMLTTDANDEVCGGWRIRPTTRPSMLGEIFPKLLNGAPMPQHRHVWEISRFAVDTSDASRTAGFSLGDTARALLVDTCKFAIANHVTQFVIVTTVAVERLINSTGIVMNRFGPPTRIGRAMSVACWVDIDAHTRHVLLDEPLPLRVAA
jgi:acyl homoserine lactone synthase